MAPARSAVECCSRHWREESGALHPGRCSKVSSNVQYRFPDKDATKTSGPQGRFGRGAPWVQRDCLCGQGDEL